MCFHKSLVQEFASLQDYYAASFDTITSEMDHYREKFTELQARNQNTQPYNRNETDFLQWSTKMLTGFTPTSIKRYHENGFDYLPMPVLTAGVPDQFKFFRWGLIPFFITDKEKAYSLRTSTLNCISEEMYEKPSFKDAAKNHQRCLIPVTGFYEWRWLDARGKEKIPYYIQTQNQPITSFAGIYSRWKDPNTGEYYYSYSILTTRANKLMEEIHNSKKRMPVIIPREHQRDWLNRSLSQSDVMDLCQPIDSSRLQAHTISKLITSKSLDTNTPQILIPQTYPEGLSLF